MSISFSAFVEQLADPVFTITVVLTLAVILVNGWTDAPNAIATAVSTRAIGVRPAIILASVMNFFGVLITSLISATVAETVFNMVDFGGNTGYSLIALCAAMVSIVVWAMSAWSFGIPTSESHALIAGLSGAAIALQNGLGGINGAEWIKVVYGLLISLIAGFGSGFFISRLLEFLFRHAERRKANRFFQKAQIAGAAGMAFMHGAQDGQKFMAVFMLGSFLNLGKSDIHSFTIPVWLMIVASAVMALGTSIGGYRIIKSVGMDMVKLDQYQGFAADLSGAACLLLAQVLGLPVSTTHTKTTAIMGVGASRGLSRVNWTVVKDMVLAWVLTFPGCGLVGYGMAKLFFWLF